MRAAGAFLRQATACSWQAAVCLWPGRVQGERFSWRATPLLRKGRRFEPPPWRPAPLLRASPQVWGPQWRPTPLLRKRRTARAVSVAACDASAGVRWGSPSQSRPCLPFTVGKVRARSQKRNSLPFSPAKLGFPALAAFASCPRGLCLAALRLPASRPPPGSAALAARPLWHGPFSPCSPTPGPSAPAIP